jgi:hypothetical protein
LRLKQGIPVLPLSFSSLACLFPFHPDRIFLPQPEIVTSAHFRLNPLLWGSGEPQKMERMLATPADAEIILRLYELRTEALMRQARAWVTGEFWPATADDYFAIASNPADPHNAWLRQVLSYWEMAAAMVLHGAVSAELFVDCNGEGFFILAKFAPILDAIREKSPNFLIKTGELVNRFTAAAQRYESVLKNAQSMRERLHT